MEFEKKDIYNILNDTEFLEQLKQKLNDSISVWGNRERLHIDGTAKMTNTLFNTTSGEITIGKYTFTGHNVSIITGTHDIRQIEEERMDSYPESGRDIIIGDGVWIASNCVILGPCTIGNNSVIAAGAIIKPNTKIPANTVWAGIPAKKIKNIEVGVGGNKMANDIRAKDVLNKIQQMEDVFLANKNETFTNEIKENISRTDWEYIKIENESKMPRFIEQEFNRNDTMWSEIYLKELNEYKDITQKIPERTRLKFVKKIINKIMKITNRYQEIFNDRVVGFTSAIAKKISVIESYNYNQNVKLENIAQNTNDQIDKLDKYIEKVNFKLDNDIEKINFKIDNDIEKMDNKLEQYLNSSNERFTGDEEWSKLLSKRIDELDTVMYRLRNELFAEIKHSINGSEVLQAKNEIQPKVLPSYREYCNKNGDVKKVNIGCGTLTKFDYINIDSRELDGVDIVADVKKLPFDKNELDEVYAAHLLEHFEDETLEKELLPYWYSLIKINGKIRIIVPNIGEMAKQYSDGKIPFSQFKEIVFGGQEYSGNYHYTMFDEDKLKSLLEKVGFKKVTVISNKRENGLCTEMEIEGIKL